MKIRAITFDLDDTLWPIAPTILEAERTLHRWLEAHAPTVAASYSIERMRELRPEAFAWAEANRSTHDLRGVRRYQIGLAFARAGGDPSLLGTAYEVFEHARQEVRLYPDVLENLERLAARYPIAGITNGFADLGRAGLGAFFRFSLAAGVFGVAKPDRSIFDAACERLGCAPAEVLHVGDDPHADVIGAHAAGLRSAWINRKGASWSHTGAAPHAVCTDLHELVAWLEAC